MTFQPKATPGLPAVDIKRIAEQLLGSIEWDRDTLGVCTCPGVNHHTTPSKIRDCLLYLNGPPTINCFHNSCAGAIENANFNLRSAIGKAKVASAPTKFIPSIQEQLQRGERQREKRAKEQLVKRSQDSLPIILEKYSGSPADLWEESPMRPPEDPREHGRLLLHLFSADDIVWVGGIYDSAKDGQDEQKKTAAAMHFKSAGEWLDSPALPEGPLICPATFKEGSHSRCIANVENQPFLVVESDELSHEDFVAVLNFLRQTLRLRAVVDTAGKSLHGWFDYPSDSQLAELRIILKELKCDTAMFTPSQAVRLPGAKRFKEINGQQVLMGIQSLIYFDL